MNGTQLLGLSHVEVVSFLKELPTDVCMVCARAKFPSEEANQSQLPFDSGAILSTQDSSNVSRTTGQSNYILPNAATTYGALSSSNPSIDRLVKAKSDGSLDVTSAPLQIDLNKMKSRSLEPLTGLAMWSSEPQIIELMKTDRGLGFSVLDYQVGAFLVLFLHLYQIEHATQCCDSFPFIVV